LTVSFRATCSARAKAPIEPRNYFSAMCSLATQL